MRLGVRYMMFAQIVDGVPVEVVGDVTFSKRVFVLGDDGEKIEIELLDKDGDFIPRETDAEPEFLSEMQEFIVSRESLERWSEEERREIGVYVIQEPVAPDNKIAESMILEVEGLSSDTLNVVRRVEWREFPTPVPFSISDIQFAHILANQEIITREEALAWVKRGEVPAQLQAVIDAIENEDSRFEIEMLVSGAKTYERRHPATTSLGAAMGYTEAELDGLWIEAAKL